jgi:maleate isomerase
MPLPRIGHLVPSSNVAVEPLCYALDAAAGHVATHHFGRLSVTRVSDDPRSDEQFAREKQLDAIRLLAEAPLDALAWNGTAASWRGIEGDRELVRAIVAATGLPATTATLALLATFARRCWRRIALAVPYTAALTDAIARAYAGEGLEVVHAARLDIDDNVAIGNVTPGDLRDLVRAAARNAPDCIAVVCTNLDAASLAAELEAELGCPIVDSIAVTYAEACRLGGADPRIDGWGTVLASVERETAHG